MMVITGAIAASVSVFIAGPVRGYVDAARRAQLTDEADIALRRMVRELRSALPNSVRITAAGGDCFIELIPTVGGGRYLAEQNAAGTGNVLDFTTADTVFDVLGTAVPPFAAGTSVVVYNLNGAIAASTNAYAGDNRSAYAGHVTAGLPAGTAARVTIAALQFPLTSPAGRFHLVTAPVTYQWDSSAGSILRHTGYGFVAAQPTAFAGGDLAVGNVGNAACPFTYAPAVVAERAGLVSIALTLTSNGESLFLHRQAHVDNAP